MNSNPMRVNESSSPHRETQNLHSPHSPTSLRDGIAGHSLIMGMSSWTREEFVLLERHSFFAGKSRKDMASAWHVARQTGRTFTGYMVEALYYASINDSLFNLYQIAEMRPPYLALERRGAITLRPAKVPLVTDYGALVLEVLRLKGRLPGLGVALSLTIGPVKE